MSKTALVTGASSGIGAATVLALLEEGFKVFAAARRQDRMAPLARKGAELLFLDLTDDPSIVAAVDAVRAKATRLDVLVNNAGYGCCGSLEDVSLADARRQFEVNLFGLARLSQLALPMMRAQKSSRIVNVSSMGAKFGEPFGAWYHASKYALEGLSDCLRMELKPFSVDVILVEPGTIRTEWTPIAKESLLRISGDTAYGAYARKHVAMLARGESSGVPSPPEVVARTIVRAVRAAHPRARYPAGGRRAADAIPTADPYRPHVRPAHVAYFTVVLSWAALIFPKNHAPGTICCRTGLTAVCVGEPWDDQSGDGRRYLGCLGLPLVWQRTILALRRPMPAHPNWPGARIETQPPRVVAVVPARDEADIIGRTVADLMRQDYSGALSSSSSTIRVRMAQRRSPWERRRRPALGMQADAAS